ncbi:uncharacterized protein BXZ73DRAFT_82656 [Epithele typhae]|uniref:uncharacterized protein n=1 Tax=Epithele typhae TaxID=378194 RepID=UPI002007CE3B|nr:uncharacterized protein BXZ73DRAFT_82656 [Epithele typhae]KAH9911736.1 hypothetical protein BXZ73DRAFT_82656 [Epithele typhae]
MAPKTYLQCVQAALSAALKENKDKVSQEDVRFIVLEMFELEGRLPGPNYETFVEVALLREVVKSRRVEKTSGDAPGTYRITKAGLDFYKSFGKFPLLSRGDRRLERMSMKKIARHIRVLRSVLKDCQSTLRDICPTAGEEDSVVDMTKVVSDAIELEVNQNIVLNKILEEKCSEKRNLYEYHL